MLLDKSQVVLLGFLIAFLSGFAVMYLHSNGFSSGQIFWRNDQQHYGFSDHSPRPNHSGNDQSKQDAKKTGHDITNQSPGLYNCTEHTKPDGAGKEWCRCHEGWIGRYCQFDIYKKKTYSPSKPDLSADTQIILSADKLQREMFEINHPARCDDKIAIDWRFQSTTGIGSDLRYLMTVVHQSLVLNQPINITFPYWPWAEGVCSLDNFWCYLIPISNCTKFKKSQLNQHTDPLSARLDLKSNYLLLGNLWYRAQLLRYAFKLLDAPLTYISRQQQKMNFDPRSAPYIAMHVRRGDACYDKDRGGKRRCIPFDQYMDAAKNMKDKYGVNRIYLATDGQDVIDSLLPYKNNFTFFYSSINRTRYNSSDLIENRNNEGLLNNKQEVFDALTDIYFMSNASYFIGTFSSNLGRLAFELMYANKNYIPPFASMDISWCFHWNLVSQEAFKSRDPLACLWI